MCVCVLFQGVRLVCEMIEDCWDEDPEARLTSLCVAERFSEFSDSSFLDSDSIDEDKITNFPETEAELLSLNL